MRPAHRALCQAGPGGGLRLAWAANRQAEAADLTSQPLALQVPGARVELQQGLACLLAGLGLWHMEFYIVIECRNTVHNLLSFSSC
jgi:hypothetical protein